MLAVEYPGYGICPGVATGPSVMENAFSALHFATQSLRWPLESWMQTCGMVWPLGLDGVDSVAPQTNLPIYHMDALHLWTEQPSAA